MHWIEWGYIGLFLATFLAATVIPFSSEITVISLLLVGYNPVWVVIVASIGNTCGGMSTYYVGYLGKTKWLNKYFKIEEEKISKWKMKIQKWGAVLSFITWLPIIGDIISAALGFFKVNVWKVLFGMSVGRTTRFTIVAIFIDYFAN